MIVKILFSFLAFILGIAGIIGSLLPILPGPQLAYIGLLVIYFVFGKVFSLWFLIVWGIVVIGILVLDYIIPAWGTKKFGGSKYGNWGSIIGLFLTTIILPVLGISFGPFGLLGIILGPFLGAYIGELWYHNDNERALKSARGSFIGFLTGTFLKIVVSIWLAILIVIEIVNYFF